VLEVGELGQGLAVGFIAHMPGAQRIEPLKGTAGAGLGHFGEPQVDGIGENDGQERLAIFGRLIGALMGEVAGKVAPAVDLQEQICNFHVRQQRTRFLLEEFSGAGDRFLGRRDVEQLLGDVDAGELAGLGESVDLPQLRLERPQALLQVPVAISLEGNAESSRSIQARELRRRHVQLPREIAHHVSRRIGIGAQRLLRMAQVSDLDGNAEPVMVTTSLCHERAILSTQDVVAAQPLAIRRNTHEGRALRRAQSFASGHPDLLSQKPWFARRHRGVPKNDVSRSISGAIPIA
jgi:hypothetical protein